MIMGHRKTSQPRYRNRCSNSKPRLLSLANPSRHLQRRRRRTCERKRNSKKRNDKSKKHCCSSQWQYRKYRLASILRASCVNSTKLVLAPKGTNVNSVTMSMLAERWRRRICMKIAERKRCKVGFQCYSGIYSYDDPRQYGGLGRRKITTSSPLKAWQSPHDHRCMYALGLLCSIDFQDHRSYASSSSMP